jgi:hypothetical protein
LPRFLRSERMIGEPSRPESALERLLVDYRGWLVTERGLAEATIIRYENLARRFLQQLRLIEVARLELGDIDWRGGRIILHAKPQPGRGSTHRTWCLRRNARLARSLCAIGSLSAIMR